MVQSFGSPESASPGGAYPPGTNSPSASPESVAYPAGAYPTGPSQVAGGDRRGLAAAPATVRCAVWGMWAGVGLSVISAVVSVLYGIETFDYLRSAGASQPGALNSPLISHGLSLSIGFTIVRGVIFIGLWSWMAILNGRGRNWARIVATVFGGLNILFGILGVINIIGALALPQLPFAWPSVIQLISALLGIAIIVAMWLPSSAPHYAGHSTDGRPTPGFGYTPPMQTDTNPSAGGYW